MKRFDLTIQEKGCLGLALVVFLIASLLALSYAQAQDTTANYSIARYKVDRLIRIALKAKECDTLVQAQQKLINDDIRSQAKADSVIAAKDGLIKTLQAHIAELDTLNKDRLGLLSIETRKSNRREFKEFLLAGSTTGALIGSSVPALGTIGGAAIGGVAGSIVYGLKYLFGKKH